MPSTFRNGFYGGVLAAFIIGLRLARLWQPENQLRLHSEHFIHQIEQRGWSALENLVAPDCRDDWGNDRALLLTRMRLLFRAVSSLTITATDQQARLELPEGTWSARIRIAGGDEAGPEISSRVNSLTKPFELRWRRESRWPWDWKLVRVSNPSLEISGDY